MTVITIIMTTPSSEVYQYNFIHFKRKENGYYVNESNTTQTNKGK